MVKCHRHGGRARSFTESMHTRIGTYSQKSSRDAKLREQSGTFASKATGDGSFCLVKIHLPTQIIECTFTLKKQIFLIVLGTKSYRQKMEASQKAY